MRDSLDLIGKNHNRHEDGEEGLARHLTKNGRFLYSFEDGGGWNADDLGEFRVHGEWSDECG